VFLAYLHYFEKIKGGLLDRFAVCVSVPTFPQLLLGNQYTRNSSRIVGGVVFYVIRVVSEESKLVVLPKIACSCLCSYCILYAFASITHLPPYALFFYPLCIFLTKHPFLRPPVLSLLFLHSFPLYLPYFYLSLFFSFCFPYLILCAVSSVTFFRPMLLRYPPYEATLLRATGCYLIASSSCLRPVFHTSLPFSPCGIRLTLLPWWWRQ
jgi:hypothetical protein